MTFWGAYKSFWKNYFNFSGVATRKEYWFVVLWNVIIGAVFGVLLGISWVTTVASAFSYEGGLMAGSVVSIILGGIVLVYMLASVIPSLSLSVRRFHDVGLSGWWYVGLYLISLVIGGWLSGWFWSLVSLVINITIIVIFALPTDHLKESNELIDE